MPSRAASTASIRHVWRRFRRNGRGSAAVEFALVAPVFFALLFAIIETAIFASQALETMTQESARMILTGQAQTASLTQAQFHVGVAIGDYVLDLWELEQGGRLDVGELGVFAAPALNPFMALGRKVWSRTRARISELLRHDHPELRDNRELRERALVPMANVKLHLPIAVAGFTDFYSSKEHATNVGTMFRDKSNPLLPNWLHIPIGYNGRASTVVVSGAKVRRPRGQLKPPNAELPSFGPCKRLDFELEMGVVIGQPSPMGEMLTEQQAGDMIFGFTLLNDWSARDIQQWEYVPLGPFQAKAFATSISPWIVTREALEPFRVHGPAQDPMPLPYLQQAQPNNYDLQLDVGLRAAQVNEAATICRTNFKYMYWSSVQQLVHHASSGCAMNVGDLLGSGTISRTMQKKAIAGRFDRPTGNRAAFRGPGARA
jgi:fumarylacetoacetase